MDVDSRAGQRSVVSLERHGEVADLPPRTAARPVQRQ